MNSFSSLRSSCTTCKKLLQRFTVSNFSLRNFKQKTFSASLVPKLEVNGFSANRSFSSIFLKSFTFTGIFCGTVFIATTIWDFEQRYARNDFNSLILRKWDSMKGYEHKAGSIRKELNKLWNNLSEGHKVFWPVLATNLIILLCWKRVHFRSIMMNYFTASPFNRAFCSSMLLSTFSHFSPVHLAMNMYVMYSFSHPVGGALGKENFLGFYLMGGVISSFSSHVLKLFTLSKNPSLGASGAIMALLGYYCVTHPDARLGILFVPNFSFTADSALKFVILIDTLGIVFKWKLFDHAAHLGGAIFGILYAYYGPYCIHYVRKSWRKVRSTFKND